MSALLKDGIYKVQGSALSSATSYAAAVADEDLWHARFGHANKESVSELLKSGAVQDLCMGLCRERPSAVPSTL